jgi:hypothetical protein
LCCHREPRAVGTLPRQPGALSSYRSSFERRCIIYAKIQIWVLFVNIFPQCGPLLGALGLLFWWPDTIKYFTVEGTHKKGASTKSTLLTLSTKR